MTVDIASRIASVPRWWHSIDLGKGFITPGMKTASVLVREWDSLKLPDLAGKRVLDIGAWDGFFSFECEKRGASVVALDYFAWCLNVDEWIRYWEDCRDKGIIPLPYETVPGLWHPDTVPGKRGFDVAREILGSRVDSIVADFMTFDLERLGVFDVSLFLGVLYHQEDPLESLKRLARVTRTLAVIESHAVVVPGMEHLALCEFYETNELNADISNWWGPNAKALVGMCRAAGFKRVEAQLAPPVPAPWAFLIHSRRPKPLHYRAVVHAWK